MASFVPEMDEPLWSYDMHSENLTLADWQIRVKMIQLKCSLYIGPD